MIFFCCLTIKRLFQLFYRRKTIAQRATEAKAEIFSPGEQTWRWLEYQYVLELNPGVDNRRILGEVEQLLKSMERDETVSLEEN